MSQFFVGTTAGSLPPSVATSYVTDDGTAIPAAHVINIIGGPSVSTAATPNGGNTIEINVSNILDPYRRISADYIVDENNDYYISCDSSGGIISVSLPDNPTTNQKFIIKDRTGASAVNPITIHSLSGVTTIDGQLNYVFSDAFESLEFLYNGGNYEGF